MGLVINVAYDLSVTSQPATFQAQYQAAVDYVVAFYEHAFTNAVTVSVTFAWNPIASGDAAFNDFLADSFSYTQIRNALVASQKSPDDITAYTTLPANNPTGDGNDVAEYELTLPQERALGLGTNTHSPDDTCHAK